MADPLNNVEFEDILAETGGFGKYQKKVLFLFMIPSTILAPWFTMNTVFMVFTPDHWCYVPQVANSNLTIAEQRNLISPQGRGSCFMYDMNYTELMHSGDFQVPNGTKVIPCNRGWQYDTTFFEETATTKWNMVCQDGYKASLVLTLGNVGGMFGAPIYGYFSDRIGRRPVFFIIVLVVVCSSIASILVNSFAAFLVLRAINGTQLPFVYQLPFIILLEIVQPSQRTWMNLYSNVAWATGLCILSLIAYLSRTWITLGWISSITATLFFGYWRFCPESPRWLISQERYTEAEAVLNKIAETNGKKPADLSRNIQILGEKIKNEKTSAENISSPADLFRYPNMRRISLIVSFCWLVDIFSYYGLQINAANLFGNTFTNFFLLALVESPGYILGSIIMAKIGRRFCAVSSLLFTGLACLVTALVSEGTPSAAVVFSMVGKLGASSALLTVYQQASELYPTTLRAVGLGFSGTCGGLAALIAPYIVYLTLYGRYIPFFVMSALCISAGVSAFYLPETLNEILPQTVSDVENRGRTQTFSCCTRKKLHSNSRQHESDVLLNSAISRA